MLSCDAKSQTNIFFSRVFSQTKLVEQDQFPRTHRDLPNATISPITFQLNSLAVEESTRTSFVVVKYCQKFHADNPYQA